MQIIRLFRKEMERKEKSGSEKSEEQELKRSLRRRDRRIAELKRRLRDTRGNTRDELCHADDIIAGLEQALLVHSPRSDDSHHSRIAELEAELNAMTVFAETLQQRTSP